VFECDQALGIEIVNSDKEGERLTMVSIKFDQINKILIAFQHVKRSYKASIVLALTTSFFLFFNDSYAEDSEFPSTAPEINICEKSLNETAITKLQSLFLGNSDRLRCNELIKTNQLIISTDSNYMREGMTDTLYRETFQQIVSNLSESPLDAIHYDALKPFTKVVIGPDAQTIVSEKTIPGFHTITFE